MDDQSAVFAFLRDPATHGLAEPVKMIETHGAAVFLAGPDVYKVKRAAKFAFMDLSTLERRHQACEAEISVNRAYAPETYLGVVPITRTSHGLALNGHGPVVEWAVHLKRFDESQTLDHVAERGALDRDLVRRLADVVLATYRTAEVRPAGKATEALAGVVDETLMSLAEQSAIFPAERVARLAQAMRHTFATIRDLLTAREKAGRVRRCHGDLHLRNIVLIDGIPTLFDAIEFDESIATIDVLYDLAFLLMDLWERGLQPQANLLLNRYLWGVEAPAEELAGLAALPLFLSLRALVRAKVDALRLATVGHDSETRRDALRYFAAAETFLAPAPLRLIGIGGLSGTGKSTLAEKLASGIGRPPGAVHLRSDVVRKRLLGVGEFDRLPDNAYGPAITERVFETLRQEAGLALRAGQSVVVDAVHRLPAERTSLAAVAGEAGARFSGLWLDAPVETLVNRVVARARDASDATPAVVRRQVEEPLGVIEWQRLDALVPIDDLAAAALTAIGDGAS